LTNYNEKLEEDTEDVVLFYINRNICDNDFI